MQQKIVVIFAIAASTATLVVVTVSLRRKRQPQPAAAGSAAGGFLAPRLRSRRWSDLAATGKHIISPLKGTYPNTTAQLFEFVGREAWPLYVGPPPGRPGPPRPAEILVPINTSDPIFDACSRGMDEETKKKFHAEGRWAYNVDIPKLVPYVLPAGVPGRTDASVVVAPGGGFKFLAVEREGTDIAEWLNSLGISAFLLTYRVNQGPLAALQDAQRAVSLVRKRAPELNLNASHVGIIGFSAGGSLVGMLSVTPTRQYKGTDDVDQVSSSPDFAMMIYPAIPSLSHKRVKWTRKSLPATFMAIAETDPCCHPERVADFWSKMKLAGAPLLELHIYAAGNHGYGRCALAPIDEGAYGEGCMWTVNAKGFLHTLGVLPEL